MLYREAGYAKNKTVTDSTYTPTLQPAKKKIPLPSRKGRVIVIAGPTATGKTQLSLLLAQRVQGEIISADSMQVYRGMDIGTAKPTVEQRAKIPHHLIDVCDLTHSMNVAEFYSLARQAIDEVLQKGAIPIVVGGSGFYLHVLLYGPPEGPAPDHTLRQELQEKLEKWGAASLYEQLQLVDPEYAKTITENDHQKIIRALEIIHRSEKKVSDFPKPEEKHPHYDFRRWFIYYPKESLYPKIEMRCDAMLKQGFLEEVQNLQKKGLCQNSSAKTAIGYRQALSYLEGITAKDQFVRDFKKASRQYAKRQFTWFKKEKGFYHVNLDALDQEVLLERILQDYEQGK